MSQRQARIAHDVVTRYFGYAPSAAMLARVDSGGLLLPLASAWALVSATLMGQHFVRYDRWSFFVDPLIGNDELHLWLLTHMGWHLLLLATLGVVGAELWWEPGASGPHRGRTALGIAICLVVLPTYIETLLVFGALLGAVPALNLASVLLRGRPISLVLPRRRFPRGLSDGEAGR